MIEVKDKMPPMLEFELTEFEDRDESIKKGEFVGIPVDVVYVMPAGSRDRFPYIYTDWIKRLKQETKNGRFPKDWADMIEKQYQAWKNGTPKPSFGTPLTTWKHCDPNSLKMCKAARITTVEELADANEEVLRHLGMGARILKKKAVLFVEQKPIPSNAELEKELTEK